MLDLSYFSKIYNQKYTVSDAVQLYPKSVSEIVNITWHNMNEWFQAANEALM